MFLINPCLSVAPHPPPTQTSSHIRLPNGSGKLMKMWATEVFGKRSLSECAAPWELKTWPSQLAQVVVKILQFGNGKSSISTKKSHRNLVGFPLLVLNIYDSYPAELHHFFRGLTTSCFTPWVRLKQSVR